MKRLGVWAQEHDIQQLYAHIFTNVPLEYYLGGAYIPYTILDDGLPSAGSYVVVSANELQNNIYATSTPPDRNYRQLLPYQIDRVGKTMFIFKMPPQE